MRAQLLKKDVEKRALLNRLSTAGAALMFFYEEEPGEHIRHDRVSTSVALVHSPYDYETLEKWLYLGNWQAVFPRSMNYEPFNSFKATLAEVERRMRAANITLLIDSFHDDIEWNVFEADET